MSVLNPLVVDRPGSGQGRGGVHPPGLGGGGGRGPEDNFPDYERRLQRAKLALILGIVWIATLFLTITTIFFLRHATVVFDRHSGTYVHEWIRIELPTRILLWNTFILLLSSCTMELARRSVTREMVLAPVVGISGIAIDRERKMPWLVLTVALGLTFLGGQWLAWDALRLHGVRISTVGFSPFFYILTGAHALHLAGGIFVLLYAGVISFMHRSLEHRTIVVQIASWYWHFMGVLWLYVFLLLQFGN